MHTLDTLAFSLAGGLVLAMITGMAVTIRWWTLAVLFITAVGTWAIVRVAFYLATHLVTSG